MLRGGEALQGGRSRRAQIALEFMIVYSFVLVIFMILFVLIVNQRSLTLNQQEYSSLQLVSQNIANYINQALSSGNGYNATVLIPGEIGSAPYTIEISSSGVVIANLTTGQRSTLAYAFSRARSLQVGGVETTSANGVSLYRINNIGQITIANSHGTIYVDKTPASTLTQEGSFFVNTAAATKAAGFDQSPAGYVKVSQPSMTLNNITVAFWVDLIDNGYWGRSGNYWENAVSAPSGDYFFYIESGGNPPRESWSIHNIAGTTYRNFPGTTITPDAWQQFVGVYNGSYLKVYLNGKQIGSDVAASGNIIYNGATISGTKSVSAGSGFNPISGNMTDMQIYNTALDANQINDLYKEGINGKPIQPANIIDWTPLNGNTKSYSSSPSAYTIGTPYNLFYTDALQMEAHAALSSGGTINDVLIGTTASNGKFNQSGAGNAALLSNSTGYVKTALAGGNVSNIAVDSYAFNGNQSTVGNLIGWWPLIASAPDAGNAVYDLSSNYNNGEFYYDNGIVSNTLWANYSSTTTNLLAAQFGGTGETPITAKLPVVSNTVFSLSLWFYPTSSSDNGGLAYFGTTSRTGWGPVASTTAGTGGCGAGSANSVYVLQSGIGWDCVSSTYKPNQWNYFALTGAPSGSGVNYTFYLNGNAIGNNYRTPIPPQGNFIIGSTAEADNFIGSISNVQLYSDTLSVAQLAQIYGEGVAGTPLGSNALLEDWWPLAGNANSYASNPDNGTTAGVTFNSINYTDMSPSNMKVSDFGGNSYAETGVNGLPTGSSARTIVAWVNAPSYSNGNCGQEMAVGYGPVAGGTAEHVGLGMNINGDVSFASNGNDYAAPMVVPLGKWTFIAVTYASGSTQVTLYMNSQSSTGTLSSGLPLNTPSSGITSYIGAWGGSGGCRFTGKIAEAQIYNTNLTATQILQLYQEGLPQMVYKNLTFG